MVAYRGPMICLRVWIFVILSVVPLAAGESFEQMPAGELGRLPSVYGRFSAPDGHARIAEEHGRSGRRALHITGGKDREVTLEWEKPTAEERILDFHAERWTARGGFTFSVELRRSGKWSMLLREDGVKVGGYHTALHAVMPAGAEALRFSCSSDAGVLIDDLTISRTGPMEVRGLSTMRPVVPVLLRKKVNPVLGFDLTTDGNQSPVALQEVAVSLEGTTRPRDILRLELVTGGQDPSGTFGEPIAVVEDLSKSVSFMPGVPLVSGNNVMWISVVMKDDADIDGRIVVSLKHVKAGGKVLKPGKDDLMNPSRIGVALRLQGDDGSHSYRIPGLVRTKAGTLIAAYDVRYKHCGDLPARIDVGVSRGTDGGRAWEKMRIAMHTGTMGDAYAKDGVGDPAILMDEATGRIWIAALWSHGNRSWNGSGPGLTPEETGQLLLSHSDDDGRTWSPLRNITLQIKDPSWRLAFNGPGAGICMKDGTLVFPAQFRAADGGKTGGKPFSTIIVSKDRGETWAIGTGARIDTTEAQVVELPDTSLMLNCRDNRGGSRTVMVTKDFGKTWSPHSTDRGALPEPVCMASLLRWDHPRHGRLYLFSNPANTRGRQDMTLKISKDDAATWPEKWHMPYDSRTGAGYSCLAPADDKHVGILYEGKCELYFMRIPLDECLR